MFHRKVWPNDWGFLPERNWSKIVMSCWWCTLNSTEIAGRQLTMRFGDSGHSWHWTVRLHAGSLHQKRPRIHRYVLAHKSPDISGHHDDAERHQPGEGQSASSNSSSRQQTRFRMPKRSFHWRRWVEKVGEESLKKFCGFEFKVSWKLWIGNQF